MGDLIKSPNQDAATIDRILKELAFEREHMYQDSNARLRAVTKARELANALETPLESIKWIMWEEYTNMVAGRIGNDLKLYKTLVAEGGRPKTAAELAKPTGASEKLVVRIARKLAGSHILEEVAPEKYAPNNLTRVLAEPRYAAGFEFCHDACGMTFFKLAEYLEKTKYKNPHDPLDGPFQYASGYDGLAFSWLNTQPKIFDACHLYMHGHQEDYPKWTEVYPYKERLTKGAKLEGDASAFVDMGGSTGGVLEEFRVDVPEWKGRLVLQDQKPVVELAVASGLNKRIEAMPHNFFEPQPVHGARAYYMRHILHDWPDDKCRQILGHLKDVMTPGYSKILVEDFVLANSGAAWQHVSLDLYMMCLAGAQERTEKEWKQLVESVGLRVTGIWSKMTGHRSIIEVML